MLTEEERKLLISFLEKWIEKTKNPAPIKPLTNTQKKSILLKYYCLVELFSSVENRQKYKLFWFMTAFGVSQLGSIENYVEFMARNFTTE